MVKSGNALIVKLHGGNEMMNEQLILEYRKMVIRKKKLIQEASELQKEHDEDVEYFINHHISDKEWRGKLEKTACNIAIASISMKIATMKMKEIHSVIFKKEDDLD